MPPNKTEQEANATPGHVASTDGLGASQEEAAIVASMKALADTYGLWHEVKEAYDRYRAAGDMPAQAAQCALYDWDI